MRPRPRTGPGTVWQALPARGYLLSPWPWRALAYLATGAVAGAATLVGIVAAVATGGVLAVILVGLPLLVLTALVGIPVARLERHRLRLIDRAPAPARPERQPSATGPWPWLTTRLRERATWRELGHALLFALVLWPLDALVVAFALAAPLHLAVTPLLMATAGGGEEAKVLKQWTVTTWPAASGVAVLGLLLLALGGYALGLAAGARAELTRVLVGGPREDDQEARVVELTRSRVRLVDAFEAERRRIERDLHDGAQQRLVALTMALGLARLDAPPGPLADQLAKAHGEAGKALEELRELIHGIHPKVLADYGLPAAVADAADRSAVPVDVTLELPGRLPQAVEAAAYFVVCEALANIGRHSGATRAAVTGGHRDGRLVLRVRDDGRGGADAAAGSGLTGLADRVSVLDGRLSLSSPPGGPTLLSVEIPCEPCDPRDHRERTEPCA
ncbi:sensor domain-containing protein [Streptomyces sp. PU10]|uniref:sensor histidine kinase n=1 Tax=unclassified Streptomyces TaxID=2593676 RepID=UPI0015922C97|nr:MULTISPECIES: sensor histidine kinase [unclassified Streptomyces]MDU0255643.1 sensor domain-containing protein [Streptomyces sp. PU10]QKW61680.1 sensor domain-containing protein [Streptomyces sp. NA03103]WSU01906.1 sensor domain-containing protein [Streptomyces sp. NBC_01124]